MLTSPGVRNFMGSRRATASASRGLVEGRDSLTHARVAGRQATALKYGTRQLSMFLSRLSTVPQRSRQ